MAVVVDEVLVVNLYAPNDRRERKLFFNYLQRWSWPETDVLFFEDFNCVQSPHLRMGGLRSGRPKSPALTTLLNTLDLEDAATLVGAAMDDEVAESTEYYTYWNAR